MTSNALFGKLLTNVSRGLTSRIFDSLTSQYDGLVVAGASGLIAERALSGLEQLGRQPLALVDNDPSLWGKTIKGIRVLSPAEGVSRHPRAVFVAAVFTHTPLRRQLLDLGASRVVSYAHLFHKWPSTFLPYFAIDDPRQIAAEIESVREAASIWSDEESASLYDAILNWFVTLDSDSVAPPLPAKDTYFPSMVALRRDEVFVDCGAFDGDTVEAFRRASGDRYRHVWAIEPDPTNFLRLSNRLAAIRDAAAVNAAVGSVHGQIEFVASGALSSHATSAGAEGVDAPGPIVSVGVVRVDDLDPRPSYVKMDIEGFELEALSGATGLLAAQQSIFAVTLYHRMTDLWQIPLFIHRHAPELRLFLRHYAEDWAETVCYAVPSHRLVD